MNFSNIPDNPDFSSVIETNLMPTSSEQIGFCEPGSYVRIFDNDTGKLSDTIYRVYKITRYPDKHSEWTVYDEYGNRIVVSPRQLHKIAPRGTELF